MAGDRVNAITEMIGNAMIAIGTALAVTSLIGLLLEKKDKKGGTWHDDADH